MTAAGSLKARTPLYDWHVAHGARMADWPGWQVPLGYSSVEQELAAVRAGCGLADVSATAKLSVRGTGVPALARTLCGGGTAARVRDVTLLRDGSALACRLTEHHLLLLGAHTDLTALRRCLDGLPREASLLEHDVTCAYAGVTVVGPAVAALLRRLVTLDLASTLPEGSCAETGLAGVPALLVRPTGVSLLAISIYVGWDVGEFVWETLRHMGQPFGLAPVGWETLRAVGMVATESQPR
jgi:aminomethyltransferase